MRRHWTIRWTACFCRIFLGLLFLTGGFTKLMPFPGVMGPVWLENALEPYRLGLYAQFIAWSEAFIGLLLLSRRFGTLGAIMLVPMLANILMITVSMQWQGTPFVVSVFCVMNLFVLIDRFDDWKRIIGWGDDRPAPGTVFGYSWVDRCTLGAIAAAMYGPLLYLIDATLSYAVMAAALVLLLAEPALRWFSQRTMSAAHVETSAQRYA